MTVAKLFDLSGKSALITGATGALGSAAARALVSAGAHVTLASGNADKLATIAESLPTDQVTTIAERPVDQAAAQRIVDAAAATNRGIDIVVPLSLIHI